MVDARFEVPIMRTTSGAVLTENLFRIKGLAKRVGSEGLLAGGAEASEASRKNRLTRRWAAVECAASVERKPIETLFNNGIKQFVWVLVRSRLMVDRLSASQVTLVNSRVFCDC